MHTLTQYAFLFLLAATLLVSGCKDDVDPNVDVNNRLEGDWDVESFTVDGTEYMGSVVTSFEMEYEKQSDTEGEAQWTVIYSNGTTERTEGDYEIQNSGQEIDFDNTDLEIEIDGDELTLEGILDGFRVEIEAERD